MSSLSFFDHGLPRLKELLKPGMLCAFDFDGTLAPIVTEPERARIPLPILRRLAALAEFTPVAIITGRSLEDISIRLDFFPEFVIGNHGMEGVPGWEQRAEAYRTNCSLWHARLQAALHASAFDPGVWIEDKIYSLSVHYRLAVDRSGTENRLRKLLPEVLPEAKVVDGKCVFNIVPPDAPDKGEALSHLCELTGAPGAVYVGDDITDESVFRLSRRDLLTVRVERSTDTAADFYLQERMDMVPLLDALLAGLSEALSPMPG